MALKPIDRTEEAAISLLTHLIHNTRLYKYSEDYMALLDFTAKMRNFAPFNAMLLNIKKPGLQYAASKHDWRNQFNRTIKDGSRPLLILWPFGPVALVYDMADTEGAAMARTILDEVLQVRPDFIEHQLAHVVRDPNGRAYNRTSHLAERRIMMQTWADYLDGLKSGEKIIPFKQKTKKRPIH